MNITFYGGAGAVTGSKHLLEVEGKRILLDCGTFQGLSDMRERNRSLPFAPESIDGVVISHAHLDHIGMLPILVKRGFKGKIFATFATRDVAQYMLRDAATIEEQDAAYRMKHRLGAPDDRVPLFTVDDIPAVMDHFAVLPYAREDRSWHEILPGFRLKFYDAGHILGSAVTVLEARDGGETKRLAYSGDVGPSGMPLLHDPEVPLEELSTLLLESTYGGRRHQPLSAAVARLAETINAVVARQGKMIVPSFSLGRTQVLVYLIHKLTDEGKIPRLPIFVDSPLATNVTEVYRRHRQDYDVETAADFGGDTAGPLAFRNLSYIKAVEDSKRLNVTPGPFMIIAGSGMMAGGRVVHHLRHTVTDPRNAILITGYQAEGTTGRRLVEGADTIELYGDRLPVKAQVALFNEFSAHADGLQLNVYANMIKGLKRVYLVHGERSQAEGLRQQLAQAHPAWEVAVPQEGQTVTI
ncbi:MAG: MBL fold metallo-hydrolase [Candidatus Andersenbacteria bacterium]|nr:MBL fold metallo-hydrolase [Candidatus Andersenbacteria bacterium]